MFSQKYIWGRMFLLSILAVFYFSSVSYSQEWAAYYGWDHGDDGEYWKAEGANYGKQTSDEGYILVGSTQSEATGDYPDTDIFLVKADSKGVEQWRRTFGDEDEQEGYVVHETTDAHGTLDGYIIFSHSEADGVDEFLLIKTDAEGSEEWRNTYGDDHVHNYGNVKQTTDGGYIIVGTRSELGKGSQVYMVKTDINGDLSWDRNYGGDYQDGGRDVLETSDGGYIAVGTLHLIGGDMNIYLVKTDSNGALQWGENFGTNQRDYGDSIQKTDDGYLIFGHTYDGLDQNPYIVKTDTTGAVEQSRIISEFEASAVTQTTDGGYAFSSMCQDSQGDLVFPCIIKTDNTFTEEWRWSWESENATKYHMPAIQQTADQGFILAGSALSLSPVIAIHGWPI